MLGVQIIDDEPIIRRGLEKMFDWKGLGFEVTCMAPNGKQALEQLEVEKVDIIITDIEMPIMNGLEFIERVRENENSAINGKEIIVLTAYEDFEYARQAIKYGITEYILKPISIEELKEVLIKVKDKIYSI